MTSKLDNKVVPPKALTDESESSGKLPVVGVPTGRFPIEQSRNMSIVNQNVVMLEIAVGVDNLVSVVEELVGCFLELREFFLVFVHVMSVGVKQVVIHLLLRVERAHLCEGHANTSNMSS